MKNPKQTKRKNYKKAANKIKKNKISRRHDNWRIQGYGKRKVCDVKAAKNFLSSAFFPSSYLNDFPLKSRIEIVELPVPFLVPIAVEIRNFRLGMGDI